MESWEIALSKFLKQCEEEAYETNSPNFNYLYYLYLDILLERYSKFLRVTLPAKYLNIQVF